MDKTLLTTPKAEFDKIDSNFMIRMRVLSSCGQGVGRDYVPGNKPTVIKCYWWEVPGVEQLLRTPDQQRYLDEAEIECNRRFDRFVEANPDMEKPEEMFPESPQSVFSQAHTGMAINPLLRAEKELRCVSCQHPVFEGEIVDGKCPDCGKSAEFELCKLHVPKAQQKTSETSDLVRSILSEVLPALLEARDAPKAASGGRKGR